MDVNGIEFPDKTVLVTPFELMRVASGNPVAFKTSDGEPVTVRLYTADEYMAAVAAVRVGTSPSLSRADAERITAPLPV